MRSSNAQVSGMKPSKSDPPKSPEQSPRITAKPDESAVVLDTKNRVFALESETKIPMVIGMGERKDPKDIPILLDWIFTVRRATVENPANISQNFPCVEALVKIGEPAVKQIQERILAATDTPNSHTLISSEEHILLSTLAGIKGGGYVGEWIKTAEKTAGTPLTEDRRNRIQKWASSVRQ